MTRIDPRTKARTQARSAVVKLLFQMEAQRDFSEAAIERFFADTSRFYSKQDPDGDAGQDRDFDIGGQEAYLRGMTSLIANHLEEVNRLIESCSENWKIDRLGKVDLAVIRAAILEILYREDIPDSVSINEAVELAKLYGAEDSGKFVNGLLGTVAKLKNE